MTNSPPRLEAFERLVDAGDLGAALAAGYALLREIDRGYGRLGGVNWISAPADATSEQRCAEFATRFIAAFGAMVCHKDFRISEVEFERWQQFNRWVELMATLSGFASTDSFLRRLGPDGVDLNIDAQDILRLFMLYLPSATIDLPFETLRHGNHVAFAVTALGWIGSRYCFNPTFFERREKLLEWLPGKLTDVKLGGITLSNVTEAYFHTSYAVTPRKHAIKAELIAQLRRGLLEAGCREWTPDAAAEPSSGKPVIVVTAEYLNTGHSIHRTHSRSIRSLKSRFHVVGVTRAMDMTEDISQLFDEMIPFPDELDLFEGTRRVSEAILRRDPAIIYHLGVGMRAQVIALASLRLAPVQCVSFGHTASTFSPAIDYFVLPEDFVGSESVFSETLLKLPPRAMPYQPRVDVDYRTIRARAERRSTEAPVRVAVPATLMKLNPAFFEALARIRERARRRVTFSFYPGFAVDLSHAELKRSVGLYLPDAIVNVELPYRAYCEELACQDFSLSPFPYGNMNTIIECVALGLPSVCLDGVEAHAHADAAINARLGLPLLLNARNVDDYIAQAVRLIDDREWLAECRRKAADAPLEEAFYRGDESLFCDALFALVKA